jgi:hypothetical protein
MTKVNNRRTRERLKKVIHVLYPEYKYIKIKNNLDAIVSKRKWWICRLFHKKDVVEYSLLINHYIPTKFTLLKYNNSDLLSTVIEDMTAVKMRKEDVVFFFFKEIVKIKFEKVLKEVTTVPPIVRDEEYEESEGVHFEIRRETDRVNRVTKQTFLTRMQLYPLYYEYVVLVCVSLFILLFSYFITSPK